LFGSSGWFVLFFAVLRFVQPAVAFAFAHVCSGSGYGSLFVAVLALFAAVSVHVSVRFAGSVLAVLRLVVWFALVLPLVGFTFARVYAPGSVLFLAFAVAFLVDSSLGSLLFLFAFVRCLPYGCVCWLRSFFGSGCRSGSVLFGLVTCG